MATFIAARPLITRARTYEPGDTVDIARMSSSEVAEAYASGALLSSDLLEIIAARSEMSDTYARRRAALRQDFTGLGSVALGDADSGQAWTLHPTSGTSQMKVIDGKLSNDATSGLAAGYAMCDLGAPVTRIGADLTFGAYSTTTGSFCLAAWKTMNTGVSVPDSNFHLAVSPTSWILGTWEGQVFTQLAAGSLSLTADGSTTYRVDCVISGTTAYISLPDGHIAKVTDASIGVTPGGIVNFETYAQAADTDTKASATSVWADTAVVVGDQAEVTPGMLIPALANQASSGLPSMQSFSPATRKTLTLSSDSQEIDSSLAQTFTFPTSGRVGVEVSAYVVADASTWLIFAAATDSGMMGQVISASVVGGGSGSGGQAWNGPVTWRGRATGTPGATVTYHFGVAAPAGTATVLCDGPWGYYASTTITPLA